MKSNVFVTQCRKPVSGKSTWIICDDNRRAILAKPFLDHKINVTKAIGISSFGTRAYSTNLVETFTSHPPTILWISVAESLRNLNNKSDVSKRTAITIALLMKLQLDRGGHVVLEGELTRHASWHPDELQKTLQHPRFLSSNVFWCALQSNQKEIFQCRYSRVVTSIALPQELSVCCGITSKNKMRKFRAHHLNEFHEKLVNQVLPIVIKMPELSFPVVVAKKKKPYKEHQAFDEQADGPGEHVDATELNEPIPMKAASRVEEHYDDCGDDCTAIDESSFCMYESSTQAPESERGSDEDDNFDDMFDSTYFSWNLIGSSCDDEAIALSEQPLSAHCHDMQSVLLTLDANPGLHDVAELFGGQGGVIQLSIRRQLHGGRNFDVTTGVNLLNSSEVADLWLYMRKHKPRIIVAGPPCTSFGPWSYLNRSKNPASYFEARRIGMKLSDLTVAICRYQLSQGNHFLIENPLTSQMWTTPAWKQMFASQVIHFAELDQCMVGLVDPQGHATRKSTLLVASHDCLVKRLRIKCSRDHQHVQLAGSTCGVSRCKYAQAWPRRLCELIVNGIIELFQLERRKPSVFPVVERVPRFQCTGCNRNAARHDPRHSRTGDCRFQTDISREWTCGACIRHRPSTHASHSFEPDECQWALAQTRTQHDRQRREPRIASNVLPPEPPEPEASAAPPAVEGIEWKPVVVLSTIANLDRLRNKDGWHNAPHNMSLTSTNARAMRTCQPRLDSSVFQWRSVFAMYPDHSHAHGSWWQLESYAHWVAPEFEPRALLREPAPILVTIFHDTADPSAPPTENKTRVLGAPSKFAPRNAVDELLSRWDVEEQELGGEPVPANRGGGSSSSRRPPPAPAEHLDHSEDVPDAGPMGQDIPIPEPDWSSWDLGKALRGLRSDVPGMKVKVLRKLHQRWYHCTASRMQNLLTAAGCAKEIIDLVPSVVDTCRVCRMWKRPSPKSATSSRLSTGFGETLQMDLVFMDGGTILHLIDEATRFTVATVIPSRTTADVISAIMSSWVRLFGPSKNLISDQEGALCSEEGSIWAERQGINLRLRPRGSHAAIVERHHEIFRQQMHRLIAQCREEKLTVPFSDLVAEACFAKNCLTSIGGYTPYQAVLGVNPRFLQELEEAGQSALTDADGGIIGASRHSVRLREIALEGILSATARSRMQLAERSKTRASGQGKSFETGELVEIYRSPQSKDLSGWRGPCTVVSVHDLDSGQIEVKWGGRIMSARVQDIRKSILFVGLTDHGDVPINVIRKFCLSLSSPSIMTLAWVETPGGWQLSKAAKENMETFHAARHFGMNVIGLPNCLGARIGRGPNQLSGIANASHSILLWWPSSDPLLYRSLELAAEQRVDLRTMFAVGVDTCWIQLFSTSQRHARIIRTLVPEEPHLWPDPDEMDARSDNPRPDSMHPDDHSMPLHSGHRSEPGHSVRPSPVSTRHSIMSNSNPNHLPFAKATPPVPSGNSFRSRSTHGQRPPNTTPTPIPIHTPISTNRSTQPSSLPSTIRYDPEAGVKRPVETENSGPAPYKHSRTEAASSSWETPHHIELPIPDDDELDTESLPSTVEYEDDSAHFVYAQFDKYLHATAPPPLPTELTHIQHVLQEEYQPCHKENRCSYFCRPLRPLQSDEFCVYDVIEKQTVIVKNMDELTAAEVRANPDLVEKALRKELASFVEHDCFTLQPRAEAENVMTSRFLFKWKSIDGVRTIKARLVVHGFKDNAAEELSTWANTSARWAQRLINSTAVNHSWKLYSADVSTAFLQGLNWNQLAALTGEPLRKASMVPPKGYEKYFQEIVPGDYSTHVLNMKKAIYGLKDAPRTWRKRLHQILISTGAVAIKGDAALYVWHDKAGQLSGITSTHVDDLKLTGSEPFVKWLIAQIEKHVGTLKVSCAYMGEFEHCGIMHRQNSDYEITIDQGHYVDKLRPVDVSSVDVLKLSDPLSPEMHALYLALVGGLSWLLQTRLDIAIYIQSLQRNSTKPRVEHLLRLNKVVRWVKRRPASIFFAKLSGKLRVMCIGDSAFRKEDQSGLAMRGGIIAIMEIDESGAITCGGKLHIIEYYSRRQRRVCRSTFAAELHSLVDCLEHGKLIAFCLTEIASPRALSASEIVAMETNGTLPIKIELAVDAKSVYDALAAEKTTHPTQAALIMVLLEVKEQITNGLLRTLWWIDTQDMLADGLTKGMITRNDLLTASSTGLWTIKHPCVSHRATQITPINSTKADVKLQMTSAMP